MLDLGAAGGLPADRHAIRAALFVPPDRFWLGACSQARFALLHAMLPPVCTHAIAPHRLNALSFQNG